MDGAPSQDNGQDDEQPVWFQKLQSLIRESGAKTSRGRK